MIAACTIIAGNYRPAARVLAESFLAHHPEASFAVLVVDDPHGGIAPETDTDRRIDWWRPSDLGLDAPQMHRLAGIYDVTELSTSLKPLFLKCLMQARGSAVIYLDPDILVTASLADVPLLAEEHGLVLTPHMTRPMPDDGRGVDSLAVLAAGAYNLGFAAVAPKAEACLDWWWEQTRRRALNDLPRNMFTDQRWADYMPSLFDHHLLKNPGYNAAYWNLHERPLSRVDGRLHARNEPLRFFHFSGFDPRSPWLLSRHQGDRPRILLSEHPVLFDLCRDYAAALEREGFAASSRRAYGWDRSADGLLMTGRIRRVFWSAVMAAERGEAPEPPDPFDAAQPGAFTEWLNTPDEAVSRRWSRYAHAIYSTRSDVQAHFTDIEGAGAARFLLWLRTDGVVQEQIPPVLLPPADAGDPPEGHGSEITESTRGVQVTGYFHAELGVGEAGRLMTRAVAATGSPYAAAVHRGTLSRQEHPFAAPGAVTLTGFDVHLLCINADATLEFARTVGPAPFAGRHTVGCWFWEVDPLPATMQGAFDHVDEVWAATEYVAGILRAAANGRKPVYTVPLPLLPPPPSAPRTREQLGLPADRFVFLFLFDFLSVMERKNPIGAIEAFCAAFAPGEGPVLVLKSINGHARIQDLERLRHAAAHRSDILIRDGYVSADEKNALLASCDAYVSLHRAEGLGLTLAEAMALGRPTIATGFSGNRQFMNDENSFLVDYHVTTLPSDCGPYLSGSRWAEPDLNHAAKLMRAVWEHPEEAARRAERGKADILFRHGVTASAALVAARLEAIREERAARAAAAAVAPEPAGPATPAPSGAEPSVAFETFTAALPRLQQLSELQLSDDDRPGQWLRRGVQRMLFRLLRPYHFQQRQFERALLDALQGSIERLRPPGAPPSAPPRRSDTDAP